MSATLALKKIIKECLEEENSELKQSIKELKLLLHHILEAPVPVSREKSDSSLEENEAYQSKKLDFLNELKKEYNLNSPVNNKKKIPPQASGPSKNMIEVMLAKTAANMNSNDIQNVARV